MDNQGGNRGNQDGNEWNQGGDEENGDGNAWNQGGNTGIQILDLIEILKYLKVFYKDFAR